MQDLPIGKKSLKLSSGQSIAVPNVIRTLIPQRIVRQYKQYCDDTNYTPFSERTMTRIHAHGFEDLSSLLEQLLERGVSKERVQGLQEALKAGKLYLKGDFKVYNIISCMFNLFTCNNLALREAVFIKDHEGLKRIDYHEHVLNHMPVYACVTHFTYATLRHSNPSSTQEVCHMNLV